MTKKMKAIETILKSKANQNVKDALCTIVSEWECYQMLRKKHSQKGLMKACYRELGVKFLGLYGLKTLEDAIKMAKQNSFFIE